MKISSLILCFFIIISFVFGAYTEVEKIKDTSLLYNMGMNIVKKNRTATNQSYIAQGFGILEQASKKGDGKSSYALGYLHLFGINTPPNRRLADKYMDIAFKQNFPYAITYKIFSEISSNNYQIAYNIAKKGHEEGNLYATSYLAYMYENGILVGQDLQIALDLYKFAGKNGNINSLYRAAKIYLNPNYEKNNRKIGIYILKNAAKLGHLAAQEEIAFMYENGYSNIVKKDLTKAFGWYKEAALGASPSATLKVVEFYKLGLGVKANDSESKKWFNILLKERFITGRLLAARELISGKIVKKNTTLAAKIITEEFQKYRTPETSFYYAYIHEKGLMNGQKDIKRALTLYYAAQKSGNKRDEAYYRAALIMLGRKTLRTSNMISGIRMLKESAKLGYASAYLRIAEILETGAGLPKNSRLALQWYLESKRLGAKKARVRIARIYARNGTEEQVIRAVKVLLEESASGSIEAKVALASIYEDKAYYAQAFKLYKELYDKGIKKVGFKLGYFAFQGYGTAKNYDTAVKYFIEGVEKYNYVDAKFYLSVLNIEGRFKNANKLTGLILLDEAVRAGYQPAIDYALKRRPKKAVNKKTVVAKPNAPQQQQTKKPPQRNNWGRPR